MKIMVRMYCFRINQRGGILNMLSTDTVSPKYFFPPPLIENRFFSPHTIYPDDSFPSLYPQITLLSPPICIHTLFLTPIRNRQASLGYNKINQNKAKQKLTRCNFTEGAGGKEPKGRHKKQRPTRLHRSESYKSAKLEAIEYMPRTCRVKRERGNT